MIDLNLFNRDSYERIKFDPVRFSKKFGMPKSDMFQQTRSVHRTEHVFLSIRHRTITPVSVQWKYCQNSVRSESENVNSQSPTGPPPDETRPNISLPFLLEAFFALPFHLLLPVAPHRRRTQTIYFHHKHTTIGTVTILYM